ncbi:Retrovirus-related Pol polyprotein from transposon TNT 1-94 [Abeliophyllum distichum]|uniref:Retrovirus-related Pol polyprotein from transposon TNT 1-94 n=1 Tax=Abeliophyllum distichum TaxID=126358 RepID=A0ABD1UMQ3_9LAMI
MENTPTNNVVASENETVPPMVPNVAQTVAMPSSDMAQAVAPVTHSVVHMPSLDASPSGTKTVASMPSLATGPTVTVPVNHGEKSEKFNGSNFKRWQQKMLFYLTTLNLARFLTENTPVLQEGQGDIQAISAVDAWKYSDFLCRNYVMNGLADSLYNVYYTIKTAKELWESLDKKYKIEDAGAKKFLVGRFLEYKMVDSKSVISQVQELQVILHEIHSEGMVKTTKVLKEGSIWWWPKPMLWSMAKGPKFGPKGGISKKMFQGKCFNCDKIGHKSTECRLPKKKKEANMVEDTSDMNLAAIISEVNLVGSNPREWWIDTGAT